LSTAAVRMRFPRMPKRGQRRTQPRRPLSKSGTREGDFDGVLMRSIRQPAEGDRSNEVDVGASHIAPNIVLVAPVDGSYLMGYRASNHRLRSRRLLIAELQVMSCLVSAITLRLGPLRVHTARKFHLEELSLRGFF